MVLCEVIKSEKIDEKDTYQLIIDYFGKDRRILLSSKAQTYLHMKTGLSMAYKGDRVDVIRSIQPKRTNPTETYECFKITKIMRKNAK